MAPSQLKRLKASIHEQGSNKRQKRTPAAPTRQDKGQLLRKQTLLPELQRRNKVGGIVDRRIGENDPRLDPEQRMLQRFAAENQRSKRASIFNLEEAEDDVLTHGGRPLSGLPEDDVAVRKDDYEESDGSGTEELDDEDANVDEKTRRRMELREQIEEMQNSEPDRKKSKKEVMEEVIAKSKLHKYERQKEKEDDDDIREALDKGMPDLLASLRGPTKPVDRSNGALKSDISKEYDERVRQMAQDRRAQPTLRTKTDEEQAAEDAERLKELEKARLKRMRGEEDEDEDDDAVNGDDVDIEHDEDDIDANEAAEFGLSAAIANDKKQYIDVEAEDDFEIDEDLVASGSDVDIDLSEGESEVEDGNSAGEEDDDFLRDVLSNGTNPEPSKKPNGELAYTYNCPQSLQDAFKLFKDVPPTDIPTVVQRIRALYHPQLHKDNKQKVSKFSEVLVEFISAQAKQLSLPLNVIESIIRHIHSLSRNYGDSVAKAFRAQLQKMHDNADIREADLITLSAIGSIYPTSDHFHQVVTPAITIMARWLGLTVPKSAADSLKGAYLVALCIKYSSFAKRYVPETIRFTISGLEPKAPKAAMETHANNLAAMVDLWGDKSAAIEMFEVALPALKKAGHKRVAQKLRILLDQAQHRRRALELHHHRPLPIKMSVPRFEESFNPDKHYDPDKARSEANKLRKEYKREQKGAMRELKKDAEFMARERLREKRERDAAYEAKQRRLIAEIQSEEGREANAYEREKRQRKGKK